MLPWEFDLKGTIPYTLVCNVTPDPNTRFKRQKERNQQQKGNKNLAEQAACFHTPKELWVL